MFTSFMRKSLLSGGYQGPELWGSTRAGTMLKDLASGADSLDIVVIGDSNTGSAVAGFWGYHNGISEYLNSQGYPIYGKSICHVMNDWVISTNTGGWRSSAFTVAATGNLKNGNASGGGTSYAAWTPSANFTRYGNFQDSWAYINGGEHWSWNPFVFMLATHPLHPAAGYSGNLRHRIRYGTFTSGGGYMRAAVREFGNAVNIATDSVTSAIGDAYSFSVRDYEFAPGSPTNQIEASPCAGNGTAGVSRGSLAIALHSQSIYAQRKGWAVTSHGYYSGYSSEAIGNFVTGVSGAADTLLTTHLTELRTRQLAAGGTGRVLLWVHSGINGLVPTDESVAKWTTAHKNIWAEYKRVWAKLGYPSDDLAIVSFVGVQKNSGDTNNGGTDLTPIRAAAKTMAAEQGDMTVVHIPSIVTYAELSGSPNYYQNQTSSDVHLSGGTSSTTDGYKLVAGRVIAKLIAT